MTHRKFSITSEHSEMISSEGEKELLISTKRVKSGMAAVDFSDMKFTRRDRYLLTVTILTTFGGAIELYLPGVFTQKVASEMGISANEEAILGVILYVSMTLVSLSLPPVLKKFDRRHVILLSLYVMVLSSIFAAAVPNYWSLLLSRVIIGVSLGMNYVVMNVFFAEQISSYSIYNVSNFILLIVFAVGAGWSAILGYLLLDKLGWRVLIVCATVPVFIPPIAIIHIFLKPVREANIDSYGSLSSIKKPSESEEIKVDNFGWRVVKGSIVNFINFLQGWGSILLTPAILKYQNQQAGGKEDGDVTKSQLLILALLFGGVKLLGRVLGYFLLRYIPFRILQPIVSSVIAGSYLAILIREDSIMATVIGVGIANMAFCVTRIELTLLETDKYFFGTERLATAASVMMGLGYLGACFGAISAAFFSVHYALILTFTLSCVQIVAFLFIYER